ncbi:protein STAY-GREEN LIKE, chloroplastic [Dorcoceras hygrometricum]|uniref:Protein STAY-GREEN LIKE, chloroplastic n=1 Tax=Dorcoceras hygrometricum TaxID=472368 RepID=A0A2Z7A792_9LAMI|nr:protein STAY-GREEN LIKE, chloroplastic [Dorcoceras hygrometricum]
MHSMASFTVAPRLCYCGVSSKKLKNSVIATVLPHTLSDPTPPYNALVFQAARLLGPPARFEASKLEVLFMGENVATPARIVPRTYTLSHCDFTADLTLTISNIIHRDKLKGWYSKDDVLAEWTEVNGNLFLNVHCYVSGPNSLFEMAAEFRYHIFSKELPLVLEAVLYGDADLFRNHQELMDAVVRVYFHSSSLKYNRMECWGPLRDAVLGQGVEKINAFVSASKENSDIQHSIFHAIFALLL